MNNANFTMKMPNRTILNSNVLPQSKGLKSTFDLSENLKTTIDFDNLYPVYWEELSPGDHFEVSVSSVCRLMPTVAPVMDNVKLKYFAFWVPNRLIWKDFTKFMGEKQWQDDKNDFLVPQINMKDAANVSGGLADYLYCPPTGTTVDYSVSSLPFRAYYKCWNDWLRAPEIQAPLIEYSGNTGEKATDGTTEKLSYYKILKKGKPLDYFTSCLPYPQSGEAVQIPLTGNAPVMNPADKLFIFSATGDEKRPNRGHFQTWLDADDFHSGGSDGYGFYTNVNLNVVGQPDTTPYPTFNTNLYADMSDVTGVSIEALRKASALQVLLERDARAGERYPELVKMHYNVTCPDFLLGRSQFLGSCTSSVIINPIVQNSSTDSVSPQGNLTGIGVGQENDTLCEISALEHGVFMIMACATSDVTYQQGLPRKFSKLTRYDYMNPAFWNLGDQAVLNKEIYLSPDSKQNEAVFGYQERYRELREGLNKITGLMRSGVKESLDVWHLAEKFENLPKLNDTFIKCNTPINRVLAAPEQPDILLDIWFDIKATRCLPVSGNPSLLAGRL